MSDRRGIQTYRHIHSIHIQYIPRPSTNSTIKTTYDHECIPYTVYVLYSVQRILLSYLTVGIGNSSVAYGTSHNHVWYIHLSVMFTYPCLSPLCLLLNNPRHYPTLYSLPALHTLSLYPYVTKCRSRLPTRSFSLDLNSTTCKTHIPFIPSVRPCDAARVVSGVIPFIRGLTSFMASHNAKQAYCG